MATETMSIRLTGDFKLEDIDKRAEELGLNRTQFVLKAVEMLLKFDKDFYKKIEMYSKGLDAPEYIIIQNSVIKQMAKEDAHKEVWGEHSRMLDEYIRLEKNGSFHMATGKELYDILHDMYIRPEMRDFRQAEEKRENLEKLINDK